MNMNKLAVFVMSLAKPFVDAGGPGLIFGGPEKGRDIRV